MKAKQSLLEAPRGNGGNEVTPDSSESTNFKPEIVWISAKDAAKILGGVSAKLVYKLFHLGVLEGAKIAGTVRIQAASIAAYLDAHSNKKAPTIPQSERSKVVETPRPKKRRSRKSSFEYVHLRPKGSDCR